MIAAGAFLSSGLMPARANANSAQPATAAVTKQLRADVIAQSKSRGVVIFTGTECPICARAKAYFQQKNIDYVEYDIDETAGNRAAFESFRVKGIPLLVVSGHVLRGFSPQAFEARFSLVPVVPLGAMPIKP